MSEVGIPPPINLDTPHALVTGNTTTANTMNTICGLIK